MSRAIFGRVLTAMVTPFDEEGRIDERACARLVDHLLANGSDGIVVAGTTGESPTLSAEEKVRLFRIVREAASGRGQVIAGTGSNDTAASIALSLEAAGVGTDGLLLVVPPYNRPSQEGLYRHFRAIAESVPNVPCILYNVPSRTARNMDAMTIARLAHDVRNIVGVKDASGNLLQCAEIVASAPSGFALYSGDDSLTFPMLAVGGCGVVSVTAHLVGKDVKAMHTAFFAGRTGEAACLNCKMLPIYRATFQSTTPSPAPVKAGLNILGVSVGGLRLPLVEANDKERGIMRAALADYALIT